MQIILPLPPETELQLTANCCQILPAWGPALPHMETGINVFLSSQIGLCGGEGGHIWCEGGNKDGLTVSELLCKLSTYI